MSLETFIRAYIGCAFWSESVGGDDDTSLTNAGYDESDLSPEALKTITEDCTSFYNDESHADALALWDDSQAGHDFWLTRNHHGAGFWDRFYGDDERSIAGKALTDASHAYGEVSLYIGDDGRIHHA